MNDNDSNPIRWHGTRPRSGFTTIPNELARDPHITANAFRVLVYLRSHDDGFETSARRMYAALNISKEGVANALAALDAGHWIAKVGTRYNRCEYHLPRAAKFTDAEYAVIVDVPKTGSSDVPKSRSCDVPTTGSSDAPEIGTVRKLKKTNTESASANADDLVAAIRQCLAADPVKVSPLKEKFGLWYPDPDPPDELSDAEAMAWIKEQKREWLEQLLEENT